MPGSQLMYLLIYYHHHLFLVLRQSYFVDQAELQLPLTGFGSAGIKGVLHYAMPDPNSFLYIVHLLLVLLLSQNT